MAAQTTDQLAAFFRSDVDDPLRETCEDDDCLWKESDVYRYMTEAVDAVMRETGLKIKFLTVDYAADQRMVALPGGIVHIDSITDAVTGAPLENWNVNDMGVSSLDQLAYSLPDATGFPDRFYYEDSPKILRLYPTPVSSGTLNVMARCTLSGPLVAGMPLAVTAPPDQALVLMYMKYMAYMKQDAETLDLDRAREYKALYDEGVKDREVHIRRERRAPGLIRGNTSFW
jgi:hypothetical protein